MAAGSIKLQANDTRIATVTFEDGAAGNVNVVVPKEGGVLASEDYVVAKTGDQTIEGIKTFSSSPIVPTPTIGDSSTKIATTEFVLAATVAGATKWNNATMYTSTAVASGGVDGDIWFQY